MSVQPCRNSSAAIGIFDSGIGGLTVYRALREILPREGFVYLGDTARLPYGPKSQETVCRYAEQVAHRLIEEKVKMLVVACNTATAQALPHLKRLWPDMPVLGVVEPGAAAAVKASRNGRIVVLATEGTILSGAYQEAIHRLSPQAAVQGLACNLLVSLVEEGWGQGREARAVMERYLSLISLEAYDTIVLGCTHFPLLSSVLKEMIPTGVSVVDSAATTAAAVADYLRDKGLENVNSCPLPDRFMVTDGRDRFRSLAGLFLGGYKPDGVDLIAL